MKAQGRMAYANGNLITLCDAASATRFRVGDRLWFSPRDDATALRVGSVDVASVDRETGLIATDAPVTGIVLAAADGDWIYIERLLAHSDIVGHIDAQRSAHIAALEAYLASCVRRRDWHGVSDAANDLRVLEAKRDAR